MSDLDPHSPSVRVGSGLDVHPFSDDARRRLVLCGVTIPDAPGLAGHSDADVAAHALADALLGAAALGDLGTRFGVDDPATAGADSLDLLRSVVDEVRARDHEIVNVDLTIVAQRPRLAAHRHAMVDRLTGALDVDASQVSVKVTSTDRLGAIGAGAGIACWATCLIGAGTG